MLQLSQFGMRSFVLYFLHFLNDTSFPQELVGSVQPRAIAVSRSRIVGAGTRAAQEITAEGFGAQLLRTTEKINYGGIAGEEHDVSLISFVH